VQRVFQHRLPPLLSRFLSEVVQLSLHVQRVFQHPALLSLSWRPAPLVFRELLFCLAYSEGSQLATMEQELA
jgi:hypothetical protein